MLSLGADSSSIYVKTVTLTTVSCHGWVCWLPNNDELSKSVLSHISILFRYIYYRGSVGNQVLVNRACISISISCLLANLPANIPTGVARARLPAWVSRVQGPGDGDSAGCQLVTRHLNKRDPVFKERALVTLPGVSCQGLVLLSWQFYQALAPLIFYFFFPCGNKVMIHLLYLVTWGSS